MPVRPLAALAAVLALSLTAARHAPDGGSTARAMAAVALRLVQSVEGEAGGELVAPLDDGERTQWAFGPVDRAGLKLDELTGAQREHVVELLDLALSDRGMRTYEDVRRLEAVLHELESRPDRPATHRDPMKYWIRVYGEVAPGGAWGWRFEGHHFALHVACAGDVVTATPFFLGASPTPVPSGDLAGLRALGHVEDRAHALIGGLTAEQRAAAYRGPEKPGDIVLGPRRDRFADDPGGIAVDELGRVQRDLVDALLDEVAGELEEDVAATALDASRREGLRFAYAGDPGRDGERYWVLHAPSFAVEYATTSGPTHVHLVWRDFDRDFGRDPLREHFERHPR